MFKNRNLRMVNLFKIRHFNGKYKYLFIFLLFVLIFSECFEKNSSKKASNENIVNLAETKSHVSSNKSNIINLDDVFSKSKEIRLSEIADSVSFLPLETKPNSLVRNLKFRFSPSYIYYYTNVFNWNGEHCCKIGTQGQGPYEEPGQGFHNVLYKDDFFYSKESKLIEYDSKGKPTGKVKYLYTPLGPSKNTSSDEDKHNKFRSGVEFFIAGKNIAVYGYPDIIFFINPDKFDIITSRTVVQSDILLLPDVNPVGGHFVTYYKDNTLFYNFIYIFRKIENDKKQIDSSKTYNITDISEVTYLCLNSDNRRSINL